MSLPPAASPAVPASPDEPWLAGPKPPSEGWTAKKFYLVLAFVLALHVALIFIFGTKKQVVPRPVTNVPHLQLADNSDELIALGDPTLFARPNAHDLVSAYWRRTPTVKQPDFKWTENPRYLAPSPKDFGAAFGDFVRREAKEFQLDFTPEPMAVTPPLPFVDVMPQETTMQVSGDLAGRRQLNRVELPSLPRNDVIAPTTVQALVDNTGNVSSAVVLKPTTDADADQHALQLARHLRFVPAPRLMLGEITFIWHTEPTNAVTRAVP